MHKNLILTSCGLSILTNLAKELKFEENIYKYSNYTEEQIPLEKKKKLDDFIEKSKEYLLTANEEIIKKTSAELNTLINYYENNINNFPKKDFHIFLHTDTYLGKKVAQLLESVFRYNSISYIELYTEKDLRTSSYEEFQISLSQLARNLSDRIISYRNSGYRIVFNLTGGFKSINSFLQTMASIYADESIYIFETSEKLLKIPRLPLEISFKELEKHITAFRILELGINISNFESKIKSLPEAVYWELDGEFSLSAWGEMVWRKLKDKIYRKNLVKPILESIGISNNLKKQFENLSEEEKFQLNKNIDKLEKCLFNRRQNCEKSLGFKEIKGEKKERHQYEMYCFDGNDSRRLYIKYENNKYILDEIGQHL